MSTPTTKAELSKAQLKVLWRMSKGWRLNYEGSLLWLRRQTHESRIVPKEDYRALVEAGLVLRQGLPRRAKQPVVLMERGAALAATITLADFD